jgi:hypothetical protein
MSGLSKEPTSGNRPAISVPTSASSECLRHLDRARIHARRSAIFVSGVAVVCGA